MYGRKFKFLESIRARLLLLLLFIFSAMVALSVSEALERREVDTRATMEALTAKARFIAEQQRDAIRRTEGFLSVMTNRLDMSALAKDPQCPTKLEAFTHSDDYLANAFIADASGRVVCNPRSTLAPFTIGDRAYFRDAMASTSGVTGDPLYGRFTERWVVPFSQRFVDAQGNVAGVMVVSLDMGWINRSLMDIAQTPEMRLGLVSSKGIVLARQPDPQAWIGKDISHFPAFAKLLELQGNGSTEVVSHDEQPRIYTFTPFLKTSSDTLYLWITVPKSLVTAHTDAQFRATLLMLFALVVVSFALAWYGGHRLFVGPMEAIALAARRIAKGELAVQTGLTQASGEIGQLAQAFDEMSGQLARVDAVTGLLNLHAFETILEQAISDAKQRAVRIRVIRIQIRDFHDIEGIHGLSSGLLVLKEVANRLQSVLGSSAVLARVGECGFAVLLEDIGTTVHLTHQVEQLQLAVERTPLRVGELVIPVQLCLGIGFYPDDGRTGSELFQHVGVALGLTLNGAGNRVRYYEQTMNDRLAKRTQRLADLHRAIRDKEFELHYQPQHLLKSGQLKGLEALVRWNHPQEGRIPPLEFISLAEESGLIIPLGEWVLEQAVTQLITWRSANPAWSSLVMAVNVSAVQLATSDFAGRLEQLLARSGLPPKNLELEITESQLMQFSSEAEKLIHRIKVTGVQLSIDDFGTGYSSLSYLKYFSVDKLKIDKSFVDHIARGGNDTAIIEATIAMAHKLGLTVIAEGVESAEQAEILKSLLCDEIQGYLLSRPLAAGPAFGYLSQSTFV